MRDALAKKRVCKLPLWSSLGGVIKRKIDLSSLMEFWVGTDRDQITESQILIGGPNDSLIEFNVPEEPESRARL